MYTDIYWINEENIPTKSLGVKVPDTEEQKNWILKIST